MTYGAIEGVLVGKIERWARRDRDETDRMATGDTEDEI